MKSKTVIAYKISPRTLEKAKELNILEEEFLESYSYFGLEAQQPMAVLEYPELIKFMEERAAARTKLYVAANKFLKYDCRDDMMLCKLYLRLAKMITEEKYEIAEMIKNNIISWMTEHKLDQQSILTYVKTL